MVLSGLRKAKSEAKASMRTEVVRAVVAAPPAEGAHLEAARADLAAAGNVRELVVRAGAGGRPRRG